MVFDDKEHKLNDDLGTDLVIMDGYIYLLHGTTVLSFRIKSMDDDDIDELCIALKTFKRFRD